MDWPDEKLVESCLAGDSAAWELIVRRHSRRIYNLAYRYVNRFDLAEDLTQETFFRVYQTLRSFNPQTGKFAHWLIRVGRNLIIDHYRRTKKEKTVAGSEEMETLDLTGSPAGGPYEALERAEKVRFVRGCLDRLPGDLKEAVLLRDIEGLTYQEIGELLQIPEGTVKSRINRGRVELARVLYKARGRLQREP
ncbi:MAG: sigma-70 family RNA polymerase sigma factor [Acidobacteria bacterium]|nr:sigma-70 family RNA polymerase sigma factor [Acidobacteriota bacterium]